MSQSHTATLDSAPAYGVSYADTAKFGMFVFLGSETMLFSGLIASYMVVGLPQMLAGNWPPGPYPHLPILMTTINTVLLVSSSFTYHFCEAAIQKNRIAVGNLWLLLSIILGATFLCIQAQEWYHLHHEGLWFDKGGVYGSSFFILTGLHGLHVCMGVLLLVYSLFRSLLGHFDSENHVFLVNTGLYWHFVDIVWVIVYLIIYIIPFLVLPHFFKPIAG